MARRSREDEAVYRAVLHLRHLGIEVWPAAGSIWWVRASRSTTRR
jgi:hypothetical protein